MLLPFFQWLGELGPSIAIRDSVWIYALDQCAHLVALAVFAGAVLIVDLRLIGGGLRDRPIPQVTRDAQPWLVWAFVALVVTGIPQVMSNAIKEYYSDIFWWKMWILLVAVIFTFTIRQKVAMSAQPGRGSIATKLVGLVSIALWGGVAVTARLIGLLT
jgi:hypothetical protein